METEAFLRKLLSYKVVFPTAPYSNSQSELQKIVTPDENDKTIWYLIGKSSIMKNNGSQKIYIYIYIYLYIFNEKPNYQ